jgi:hypothetical protein
MMLTVTTKDGVQFRARDEKGIVRAMRRTQWNAPERKQEYIEEVCDRVFQMTGKAIGQPANTLNPASFLMYLIRAGLIQAIRVTPLKRKQEGKHV